MGRVYDQNQVLELCLLRKEEVYVIKEPGGMVGIMISLAGMLAAEKGLHKKKVMGKVKKS